MKGLDELNRTQALVLAFFAVAWIGLVVILIAAPEIYGRTIAVAPPAFLAAISLLVAFFAIGVARRWRWTFWLLVVAFLAGALRVPVAILQLAGAIQADGPAWYAAFQGAIGVTQVAVGAAMLRGYRREGVWGRF